MRTKENVKTKDKLFSIEGIDISIIFVSIFLSIFCLIFVYSALVFEAKEAGKILNVIRVTDIDKTIIKTLVFIFLGLGFMLLFAGINVEVFKKSWVGKAILSFFSNPLLYYVISCGMFVFIEIMKHVGSNAGGEDAKSAIVGAGFLLKANGAYRWIRIPGIGLAFQPSEVAKVLLIICFSLMIYNAGMCLTHKRGMILYMGIAAFPAGLILVCSSDLSSSIVTFLILFTMMIVAAPNWKNTLAMLITLAVIGFIAFAILVGMNHGKEESDIHPYQAKRILAWLYPNDYPASADQTNQAMYAIGSGGLYGEGIGNSMQKVKKLPEAQNDMIFALICEELGLFGGLGVILLYFVLILRMYMIAINVDNLFERMVVVGVIAHVALQVIINICVVTRLFPNTGIPLPLISSGGSSILFMYMELGLVLNIGKKLERR